MRISAFSVDRKAEKYEFAFAPFVFCLIPFASSVAVFSCVAPLRPDKTIVMMHTPPHSPLAIAVLASHGGSNFQAILDHIADGRLAARVVLVVSNNSASKALERARRANVPWRHISTRTEGDDDAADRTLCAALHEAGAEVVVLAGYMKKLGPRTLEAFCGRILNIHPALLPRHGGPGMYGLRPHEAALAAGDTESGATVHAVTSGYDEGPILRQRCVPIQPDDTPETLQQRVLAVEHELYSETLADIASGVLVWPVGG